MNLLNENIYTVLIENDFCKIVEIDGLWIRIDKISNTILLVDCYFNKDGILVRK